TSSRKTSAAATERLTQRLAESLPMIVLSGITETNLRAGAPSRSGNHNRRDRPMTALQNLRDDLERIEQRARVIDPLRKHWEGRPDTAFMAKSARDALDHRLGRLSTNFPRLLVTSYVDRMTLTGWTAEDGSA